MKFKIFHIIFKCRHSLHCGQYTFCVKDQTLNISAFVGHTICCNEPSEHENRYRQHINKCTLLCSYKALFTNTNIYNHKQRVVVCRFLFYTTTQSICHTSLLFILLFSMSLHRSCPHIGTFSHPLYLPYLISLK